MGGLKASRLSAGVGECDHQQGQHQNDRDSSASEGARSRTGSVYVYCGRASADAFDRLRLKYRFWLQH